MTDSTSPKIVYQEANPYGAFTAYIEDDGQTMYLYLQAEQSPDYPMKSVWLANRIKAPETREHDFGSGLAPVLTVSEVEDPNPSPAWDPQDIHFIWTEEGDGVAVFYKEKLYAFLPPWSGIRGLHGYCMGAKTEALTAHPLGNSEHGVIPDRIENSRRFWEFRSEKDSWNKIQSKRLSFLEERLGKHTKYWSADGGSFPPLGIALFEPKEFPNVLVYVTVGMSGQNMPGVELYKKDFEKSNRIELVLACRVGSEGNRSESWVPHQIGEIIKYPWNHGKWFGHGHTISMTRRDPEAMLIQFNTLFFRDFPIKSSEVPDLSGLIAENGNPVQFLTVLPICDEERIICQENGSGTFLEMLEASKVSWIHDPERASVL